ncbi:DNA N-6-adenine-methyltransferase [Frondihabitans australicus]|uniref:Phage N-6-adenine-methyltransferase n=1 Tax=Frondihabitans australicus TaxID=386892 RepID=A0A495IKN4_9MICO|nr:DNA N-6-adenine-methyltransferase [Frondihabitans australicus]RKR76300.1 phage N-6-adenine-methyltransferase [Frondihabitans australicus]
MTHSPNPTQSTPVSAKKAGFTHETAKGATDEWYTPRHIFEALAIERFAMDVCSPGAEKTHVPADVHLTIVEDGLTTPWAGTVWMNPPYSDIAPWMRKLADHGDGIALVFARPDTKWFQAALKQATVACFINGRISFIKGSTGKPAGSPGAGSVLLAYGKAAADAVLHSELGICVTPILAS